MGNGITALLIRKLDTRWSWVASLMPRQLYPTTNSPQFPLHGPQLRSGHFREDKPFASTGTRSPVRQVRRFVTIPLTALRFNVGCISIHLLYSVPTPPRSITLLFIHTTTFWGTQWRSWLRHCATSRKVSGSIPDGVIGIFHWHNPSGRTMALESTQPLTEKSTRNIFWG